MRKPNVNAYRDQLSGLTNALARIDHESQEFLRLSELSPTRRLQLSDAARTLKREIILAQTDLWNSLLVQDRKAFVEERTAQLEAIQKQKHDTDYIIHAEWKPKKAKQKVRKK